MSRSLSGLNVLDFSHALSGPFCSMLLAELGANIVKVESPNGDHFRPTNGGTTFAVVNRNKRSLCIDLKNPKSASIMERLIARSDIVIENFTPGVVERLGYDYLSIKEKKADIIWVNLFSKLVNPDDAIQLEEKIAIDRHESVS